MAINSITYKNFFTSLLLMSCLIASAQHGPITVTVCDAATRAPLRAAGVRISRAADTAMLRSGITDGKGRVQFGTLPAGDYALHIRSMGYPDTTFRFSQPPGHFPQLPDSLFVSAGSGVQLNEVTIKDNTPAVQMKGDTIEYNAGKFRTKENAVVEDLLKKLPGVNVERDGSIKAQGEQVRRVLVDGKEFFGSDPAIATRNLPANMVDKVQVLDKKSEAEEFTGVADGNREKTINIVTKKNMKRGFFGNASAGKGDRGNYEGGTNVNSFVADKQLSLLFKANNVNKSGFSGSELIKMAASNNEMFRQLPPAAISELVRMKGVTINGSPEALAEVARPRGLTDTKFGGVNFNTDREQLRLRSSYFFNTNYTTSDAAYSRKYLLPDTTYNYDQTVTDAARNTNHRVNLSADIRFSERTSLKISPRADITGSTNNQQRSFRSLDATGSTLLNEGSQSATGSNDNTLASSEMILRQRLSRKGSTLMLTVTPEYYHREGTGLNRSSSAFYNVPGGKREEIMDQQTSGNSTVSSVNAHALFTQPLFKTHSLQVGQMLYYSNGNYKTLVTTKDAEGNYTSLNERLSDIYGADNRQYVGRLAISGTAGKLTYTAGAGWQHNRISGFSDMKGYRVNGSYQALLPSLYAEMKFTKKSRLTFRYNMSANTPSVSHLQPLEDNSDPLYVRKGNPGLKQEKGQQWHLAYNSFSLGGNSAYVQANFNWQNSAITDSASLDRTTGKQFSMPVNVSGNYRVTVSAGQSLKIDNNGSSITAGINASIDKTTTFTNGQPGINRNYSITPDAAFNYYIGNNVNLSARGGASWNVRRFSGASLLPEKNWSFNYGTEAMITLPLSVLAEASLDGFSSVGMTSGYNNTILLLNAALTKGIGSKLSLRIEARDLLNRNENINRLTGNGYIEDRKVNTLGRYFLLSAVYKFRHFPKPRN